MTIEIEPGQVWEHRALCRLCTKNTGGEHRHRYVVLAVDTDAGHVVVRDLNPSGQRIEPFQRYPRPLDLFGSLAKGGLRLAGHWIGNRFEGVPEDELDARLVDHERIPIRDMPQWRGKLPATVPSEVLAA